MNQQSLPEQLRILLSERLHEFIFVGIHIIFIAIVFEFLAWWIGRRIEKWTAPLMGADAGRETAWRARRRATLRQLPKVISRTLCYTIALILVFDAFRVPVMALSLALGAVALLFGSALIPQMRDVAQGYTLLAEDALAPGDLIEANDHTGVVEKFTMRGVWLRDREGKTHLLSHRDLDNFIIHSRKSETEREFKEVAPRSMAYDPLAEAGDDTLRKAPAATITTPRNGAPRTR